MPKEKTPRKPSRVSFGKLKAFHYANLAAVIAATPEKLGAQLVKIIFDITPPDATTALWVDSVLVTSVDENGKPYAMVNFPPADHDYTVTVLAGSTAGCSYKISTKARQVAASALTPNPPGSADSTGPQAFTLQASDA